jgi:hypothetical protein
MQVLSSDGKKAYDIGNAVNALQHDIKNNTYGVVWVKYDVKLHEQIEPRFCKDYTTLLSDDKIKVTFPLLEKALARNKGLTDVWLIYTDRSGYSGGEKKIKDYVKKEAFYTAEIIKANFESIKEMYGINAILHLKNIFEDVPEVQYGLTKEFAFQWFDKWVRKDFVQKIDKDHKILLAIAAGITDISRYCEEIFFAYFRNQTILLDQDQATADVQPTRIHDLKTFNAKKTEIIERVVKLDFHGALSLLPTFTKKQKASAEIGFELIKLACEWMDEDYHVVDENIKSLLSIYSSKDNLANLLKLMKETNNNTVCKYLIRYRDLLKREQYIYAGVVFLSLSEVLAIGFLKILDPTMFIASLPSGQEQYDSGRLSQLDRDYPGKKRMNLNTDPPFHWSSFLIRNSARAYCQEKGKALNNDEKDLHRKIKTALDSTEHFREERNAFIHRGEGFAKTEIDKITKNRAFWNIVDDLLEQYSLSDFDWRHNLAEEAIKSLQQMEHHLF